jgi:hypothetical protein
MDPITAGLAIAGLGLRLFGGNAAAHDVEEANRINKDKVQLEQQNEDTRHKAMVLSSQRSQLEIVRNNQRARAMSVNNAVSQGAQFGSGLQGGLGQISGQTNYNLQGNNQQLEFGNDIYQTNKKISADNMRLSDVQTSQSNHQALSSLGSSISSIGGPLGQLAQGVGGLNFGSFAFGGGSPSGYGRG